MYILNNIKYNDIFIMMNEYLENKLQDNDLLFSKLVDFSIKYNIKGNIWSKYILFILIHNDTTYTRSYKLNNNKLELVEKDLKKYYDVYTFNNIPDYIKEFNYIGIYNEISTIIDDLYNNITDYNSFSNTIHSFYKNYGVSDMAIYKAFRISNSKLLGISNISNITFKDIIGYEEQIKLLKENTYNFINGKSFNNVLLYGDSGTGKSSSIKALLNEYYKDGLRIIEVYKHQMKEISTILSNLSNSNYHYIIYMDDLSFEDDEVEYKYLKSIIEGGIEEKPKNVVVYATSNRRHLIKENSSDNSIMNDLHVNETKAEKLSLAYRFGLQIFYSQLSHKKFKEMVLELARRNNIEYDQELLLQKASSWELTYGSLSGRCAKQFINYISNEEKAKK